MSCFPSQSSISYFNRLVLPVFLLFFCFGKDLRAESIPLAIGVQAEYGPDPFLQEGHRWVSGFASYTLGGLVQLRAGFGMTGSTKDSSGTVLETKKSRLDFRASSGWIPGEGPYLLAGWSRNEVLSDEGDRSWTEIGFGFGFQHRLSLLISIFGELEQRMLNKAVDPDTGNTLSGFRTQLNLGLMSYLF